MTDVANDLPLPRRQSETLRLLLQGKSEKEVAAAMGVSRHTVHVYVKALYRQWDVASRAELLSRVFNGLLRGRMVDEAEVDARAGSEV